MDPLLNPEETRLLEWLETKDFDQLTAAEQQLVEVHMPLSEYQLQRRIMTDAAELGVTDIAPKPFLFPQKQSTAIFSRTIPMYQAVLAVAAVFIFFLWIWPKETRTGLARKSDPQDTTQVRPLQAVFNEKIVHDTIVRYVPVYKTVPQPPEPADQLKATHFQLTSTALYLPELNPTLTLPELTPENLATSGTSLKDDQLSSLVRDINGFQRR
jgi:hypothetical protein